MTTSPDRPAEPSAPAGARSDDDYTRHDALGLAELVRRREVSPRELVDAAIRRIEALDGALNAVCLRRFDEARAAADGPLPEGPFRGVPTLVKDILAAVAGWPTTSGSRFLADFVPPMDSELVARMRRAGFVLLGKTTSPELGLLPATESALFGATKNPWDPSRTPGGSSGGAAAATAARYVPLAHASDGGGSIRIPAACCGLFGLKPTRARTTLGPFFGDVLGGLVLEHCVSRTVRDSAAFLDAVAGPMPGDPYHAPPQRGAFLDATKRPPPRLRVAFTTASLLGTPVEPEIVDATRRAAALLAELGHTVTEATPPVNPELLQQSFTAVWLAGATTAIEGMSHMMGRSPKPGELEAVTQALVDLGRAVPAHAYLLAQGFFQMTSRALAGFFEHFDVLLTPSLAEHPVPLGTFEPGDGGAMGALLRAAAFTPFTPLWNATGNPAASVPLFESPGGLPIGAHFAARWGEEDLLFALAAELEAATRFSDRRPRSA